MLIRIVKKSGAATVIEHVCSFCAQEHGIDTTEGTWSAKGWCYLCGGRHGAGLDGPKREETAMAALLGLLEKGDK